MLNDQSLTEDGEKGHTAKDSKWESFERGTGITTDLMDARTKTYKSISIL